MPLLNEIPQLEILKQIAKARKTRVYLIGGFLRDYLLKRPCFDLDFAVEKDAIALARAFAKKIKGAFVLLDKEHGCGRVATAKSGRAGEQARTFDFADFRAPGLKGDLRHRDFTINTFCVDIQKLSTGSVIASHRDDSGFILKKLRKARSRSERSATTKQSLWVRDCFAKSARKDTTILDLRKGRKDLKFKIIRMNSAKVFKEDPLRLLRAFSLRAQLGFKIEPKTLQQIKRDTHLLREVSFERIRDELFKVLSSSKATENLRSMDKLGLLSQIIPPITVMYGVKQGGYHHLDVWPHTLEAVSQFEKIMDEVRGEPELFAYLNEPIAGDRPRFALIKLALLLHDIGKPGTRKKEGERYSFHGHEHVGRDIARPIAKALKLSTDERYALENMVLHHLRPARRYGEPQVRPCGFLPSPGTGC